MAASGVLPGRRTPTPMPRPLSDAAVLLSIFHAPDPADEPEAHDAYLEALRVADEAPAPGALTTRARMMDLAVRLDVRGLHAPAAAVLRAARAATG